MSFAVDPHMAANQASTQDIQARSRAVQSLSGSDKITEAERGKRLREACEGFEAVFIQKMWEQMRATLPKDGFLKSKAEEFWQGMYDQELGKSMASNGGIGLADMMVDQLGRNQKDISVASHFSANRAAMGVPPSPILPAEVSEKLRMPEAEEAGQPENVPSPVAVASASQPAASPVDMSIYDGEAELADNVVEDAFFQDSPLSGEDLEAAVTAQMYQNMENDWNTTTADAEQRPSAVSQTLDELAAMAAAQAGNTGRERGGRGLRESTASPVNVQLQFQQMTGQAPYRPEAARHVPQAEERAAAKAPGSLPFAGEAALQAAAPEQHMAQPTVTRITYQTNLPPNQRKASPFQNGFVQELIQSAAQVAKPRQELSQASSATGKQPERNVETAPQEVAQVPVPEALAQPEPQPKIETDILAGIGPRYVPTRLQSVLNGSDTAASLVASQAAPVAERPFQAGGPVLRGPEPVTASMPLGNPSPPAGSLRAPVSGEISSGFGWRVDPFTGERAWHPGVDIKALAGESVRAAMPGTVSFVGKDPELGNLIIVDHGNNLTTRYGHNQDSYVRVGQRVDSGTELARAGASGRAAGPHVHFEVRRGDLALNPEPLLGRGRNLTVANR